MSEIFCKICDKTFYSKQTKQRHDTKFHYEEESDSEDGDKNDDRTLTRIMQIIEDAVERKAQIDADAWTEVQKIISETR